MITYGCSAQNHHQRSVAATRKDRTLRNVYSSMCFCSVRLNLSGIHDNGATDTDLAFRGQVGHLEDKLSNFEIK